jgi:dihydrofolate reductase
MGSFRLYIASSLDGFAAPSDGSVEWLADYPADDMGFSGFLAGIDTVVMGRRTFEQIAGFVSDPADWPYTGKRCCVLGSVRPRVEFDFPGVEYRNQGFRALAKAFAREGRGDTWLVGGPETIHRAFADDVVDRLELFIIPRMLGEGLPLFSWSSGSRLLTLTSTVAFANGVVLLDYAIRPSPPAAA